MRIAKTLLIILIISILTLSVVYAQYTVENPWQIPFKRDTGSAERKRAIAFGEDFTAPVGWTGIKYSTGTRQTLDGFKGATDIQSNLPYNEFIIQGRNPERISNWDPRMRGYTIMDQFVKLTAVETPYYDDQGKKMLPNVAEGAARIVSDRDSWREQYSYMPRTSIYLRVGYLPELSDYELYEAWLVDEDTGYALSIGRVIPPGTGQLSDLRFNINNYAYTYDYIMVTKERFPEYRKRGPLGDVILLGEIPQVREATMPLSAVSYYQKYFGRLIE